MHSCIEKLFRTRDLGWIADLTRRACRSPVGRVLCTNAFVLVFGLTNSVLLSRWLGPQGRGELAAAMLWPSLLTYLSSMGLIQAITYYSALPEAAAPVVWCST